VRTPSSSSLLLGVFAVLAIVSLSIRAAAGPPRDGSTDGHPGQFERIVSTSLQRQHFATRLLQFRLRSTLVLASRGTCRLAVRDARITDGVESVFAQDARSVGPVRYLYKGWTYLQLPQVTERLGRFEAELMHRLGSNEPSPLLVAIASTPSCGTSNFGIENIRLSA
jgi:hypothetical protein